MKVVCNKLKSAIIVIMNVNIITFRAVEIRGTPLLILILNSKSFSRKTQKQLTTSQRIGKLHQIMRQYFYLIGHSIVGDDLCMDKVFMQKSDAISYGRRLANKNPEFSVILYKQLISNSSKETIKVVKQIPSTKSIKEFDRDAYDIPKEINPDIEIPW